LTNLSREFREGKETLGFHTAQPPFHLPEPSLRFFPERLGHAGWLNTETNTHQENSLSLNSFVLIWV